MLRLAFDFIITWRETRTRPNAYHLCAFFESESERMNEIADWLINRVKQKRQL